MASGVPVRIDARAAHTRSMRRNAFGLRPSHNRQARCSSRSRAGDTRLVNLSEPDVARASSRKSETMLGEAGCASTTLTTSASRSSQLAAADRSASRRTSGCRTRAHARDQRPPGPRAAWPAAGPTLHRALVGLHRLEFPQANLPMTLWSIVIPRMLNTRTKCRTTPTSRRCWSRSRITRALDMSALRVSQMLHPARPALEYPGVEYLEEVPSYRRCPVNPSVLAAGRVRKRLSSASRRQRSFTGNV